MTKRLYAPSYHAAQREYARERYRLLRAAGRCLWCKQKTGGPCYCEACKDESNRQARRLRLKRWAERREAS